MVLPGVFSYTSAHEVFELFQAELSVSKEIYKRIVLNVNDIKWQNSNTAMILLPK